MNKPFFARFLENQQTMDPEQIKDMKGGLSISWPPIMTTDKWPSDNDEDVTLKYPSDSDEI